MKKILSLLLILSLLFGTVSFVGCADYDRFAPAMWVLEGGGGNKIYFLGSIHIADDTMYPLPDYINEAFEASEYLAVEFDVVRADKEMENYTQQQQIEYASRFIYKDGTTAKDHMTPEQYETVKAYMQNEGIYDEAMEYYMLCIWESEISEHLYEQTGYDTDMGVDRHFINRAYDAGKTVLDVESLEFQLDMMVNLPESIAAESMYSMATMSTDMFKMQLDYQMSVYKRGRDDILASMSDMGTALQEFLEEETESDELNDSELYMKMMLTDRNIGMADKAIEYLDDGKNVFFVVGAAHMGGDDGIIKLLQDRGYAVTRIEG